MTDLERLPTDLSYDDAVILDGKLEKWRDNGVELTIPAYQGRIWLQLGYVSWEAYCADRLSGFMPALERSQRREAVAELRDAGMTTRAIGSALGVSVGTVHSDLSAGVQNRTPEKVIGRDGKEYSSKQPPRPVANPFTPPEAEPEPTTLPESPQSQEVPPVLSGAVLDRDQFLERRAEKEAADHARHVSDRLRHIVEYCVEGLGSPAIRAQYVDIYEPPAPDIRERVAVNADNIEAAADALRVFAQLWRERRESAEEQH